MTENRIQDGSLEVTWGDTVDDAKEVLAQLKTTKSALQADKRELTAKMAEIRADYRERVAHRIPGRKRGLVGLLVQSKRAGDRAGTNEQLRPFERQKQEIEEKLVAIDRTTGQLRVWIVERGGARSSASKQIKSTSAEIIAAIEGLAKLRDVGAITAAEYEEKKGALLARL